MSGARGPACVSAMLSSVVIEMECSVGARLSNKDKWARSAVEWREPGPGREALGEEEELIGCQRRPSGR